MPDQQKSAVKKWGVGVELAADHLGPLRLVAALTEGSDDLTVGVHVIPDRELLNPLINHEEAQQIRQQVAKDVAEVMTRAGLDVERVRAELVEDDQVERGLSESAARLGVDALVVGRRAKRDEDPLVRLGEVTRRLLRRLPVPVVVVPPDFGVDDDRGLGEGPIIVGVDLSEHCNEAAKFAAALAARLDLPLLLAHGSQAFHWGVSYIPTATMERLQNQTREAAGAKLREWAAAQGLGHAEHHVFMGDPAKHLLQVAHAKDAAMVVTGSRMLGPVERLFLSSVSSELAAAANCPVAVVPGG
ncbi:Universal stress protein family protein [Enhygromyxa salina]|uniref:Universal stress protein family protein n=1 Tax=Enhygromyxa salina TaxID=215803 RepID=A0A2S9YEB9_9BACT|nr:universal stress protein [Enhygromyxa salina]PRQ03459.1 Universal stress protein family protein [Enhygromyxa salina]